MSVPIWSQLLTAPILFFCFGAFSGLVRSNLEIPQSVVKFFSLFLLFSLGFKGGVALNQTGLTLTVIEVLAAAALLALVVPAYSYAVLRYLVNRFDAAAIAATYGSVSAVTYITAYAALSSQGIPFGGYMTVALVIMESPAIVMAVLLSRLAHRHAQDGDDSNGAAAPVEFNTVLREAFTDGALLILLGSMLIGWITGSAGKTALEPFYNGIFPGILCFFLLDMGLLVIRRLRELSHFNPLLAVFAIVVPLLNAALATGLAAALGLAAGDAILLVVLAASASYIAVPAVVRYAIPEANPGLYFTMSLAITFPFNIVVGITLYTNCILALWGTGS